MDNTIPPVATDGKTPPQGTAGYSYYFRARPLEHDHPVRVAALQGSLQHRKVRAREWKPEDEWNLKSWLAGVEAAALNPKAKMTARHIAEYATSRGWSTVDNRTLAIIGGVNRDASITARVDALRAAGFIETTRRYNKSSYQRLTDPHGIDPHPLDMTAKDLVSLYPDGGNPF